MARNLPVNAEREIYQRNISALMRAEMGPFWVLIVVYFGVIASACADVSHERIFEATFESKKSYADPFNERPGKPNILLIVVDDLGYGELGCQGNPEIPTPNIDSIALHGIRFTNAYSSAPACSPARAGLLTGRYQTRFGHEFNLIGLQNRTEGIGLPLSEQTLPQLLGSEGYVTALIGKWHLGAAKPYHPLNRGFREFFGFLHEGHFYVPPPYRGVISWFRVRSLPRSHGTRRRRQNYVFSAHMGSREPFYDEENPILSGWGSHRREKLSNKRSGA